MAIVTIIVILGSGSIVYAMNTSQLESKTSVDLEKIQESPSEEIDKIKEKEEVDEKLVNKDQQIEKNNTEIKSDNTSNQEAVVDNKSKEEIVNTENDNKPSQPAKSPITYKSENLGVAFDIPASWENNYLIKEVGTEIAVIMKSNYNSDDRGTLLFIIDGDIYDYDNGSHLDTIGGIEKKTKINGKDYLVGGPTDYRDELKGETKIIYDTMLKERSNVLLTLRGI